MERLLDPLAIHHRSAAVDVHPEGFSIPQRGQSPGSIWPAESRQPSRESSNCATSTRTAVCESRTSLLRSARFFSEPKSHARLCPNLPDQVRTVVGPFWDLPRTVLQIATRCDRRCLRICCVPSWRVGSASSMCPGTEKDAESQLRCGFSGDFRATPRRGNGDLHKAVIETKSFTTPPGQKSS